MRHSITSQTTQKHNIKHTNSLLSNSHLHKECLTIENALAKKVVQIYHLRMQIEESFHDIKSHSLSLTHHHTSSVKRLQVLLLIATLAIVVLWLLGMVVVLKEQHYYQVQANSLRKEKYSRWCLLAYRLLSIREYACRKIILLLLCCSSISFNNNLKTDFCGVLSAYKPLEDSSSIMHLLNFDYAIKKGR